MTETEIAEVLARVQVGDQVLTPANGGDGHGMLGKVVGIIPMEGTRVLLLTFNGNASCHGWEINGMKGEYLCVWPYMSKKHQRELEGHGVRLQPVEPDYPYPPRRPL